jgi:hypothetical protein
MVHLLALVHPMPFLFEEKENPPIGEPLGERRCVVARIVFSAKILFLLINRTKSAVDFVPVNSLPT